jgi:hypothetical protein
MSEQVVVSRWTAYGTSGLARIIKGYTGLGMRSAEYMAQRAVQLGGHTFATDTHVVSDPTLTGRVHWRVVAQNTKWELQRLAPPGEKEAEADGGT